MKKDIKQDILQVKEDLNKIIINSEVIENYNKLTCDKLQELDDLDIHIKLCFCVSELILSLLSSKFKHIF